MAPASRSNKSRSGQAGQGAVQFLSEHHVAVETTGKGRSGSGPEAIYRGRRLASLAGRPPPGRFVSNAPN